MTAADAETRVKKVSTVETGHYKNLTNLNLLIESLKSYCTLCNSSNINLSIASLKDLAVKIDDAMTNENNAETASFNLHISQDTAFSRIPGKDRG